jgi:hypothetical protein
MFTFDKNPADVVLSTSKGNIQRKGVKSDKNAKKKDQSQRLHLT